MLGAIVLNSRTLGFKQVISTFGDFSRDCSPSSAFRAAILPRHRRVHVRRHRRERVAIGVLRQKTLVAANKRARKEKIRASQNRS